MVTNLTYICDALRKRLLNLFGILVNASVLSAIYSDFEYLWRCITQCVVPLLLKYKKRTYLSVHNKKPNEKPLLCYTVALKFDDYQKIHSKTFSLHVDNESQRKCAVSIRTNHNIISPSWSLKIPNIICNCFIILLF